MEVAMLVTIAIIGFIILAIGGGIGFWLFIITRTKKMTWQAKVYQLGDGEVQYLDKYKLNELKAYTDDIIEKVDKKDGSTHYWLQKMRKAVPVVTADCVEVWGSGKKLVKVLLQEDTCTLLKSAYDSEVGAIIFKPMPHDRINMIKTEQSERKERIQDKKDILSAIAPYVMTGIFSIALVIGIYIIVQGAIQSSENNMEGSEMVSRGLSDLSNSMLIIYGHNPQSLNNTDAREIKKENVPLPP